MTPTKLDPKSLAGKLRAFAMTFPEATEEFPWGERAIKVKSKAFLFMRAEGKELSFSVKLPTSAADALDLPYAESTGYGLGKHGWVTFKVDGSRSAPYDEFAAYIEESFRAVAPKRVIAAYDAKAQTPR